MNQHVKQKVALFVGSDVVAHREMVATVKALVENDYEPILFYPKHQTSKNVNAHQQAFKDYAFVERLILPEIFEYLEENPSNGKSFPTPKQICKRYNLQEPIAVENINDPDFFMNLAADPQLAGCISLRCTQMFKPAITRALTSPAETGDPDRFLINIHSGPLPHYRGLYSTPRAMFDAISNPEKARQRGVGKFGCTVHHIDAFEPDLNDQLGRYKGIDTGNIIDLRPRAVDPGLTVYATNIQLAEMASASISDVIGRIARGDSIDGYEQVEKNAAYHSYATPLELEQWKQAGLVLFHRDEVTQILTEMFSDWRTKDNVHAVIQKAMDRYFDQPRAQNTITGAGAKVSLDDRGAGRASGRKIEPHKGRTNRPAIG